MGGKNNCMNISSDKLTKSHEKTWIWLRKEKLKRDNNFSDSNTKQETIILKRKSIIRNRIASVGYMVTNSKWLII